MIKIILNFFNFLRVALSFHMTVLLILVGFILVQPLSAQVKPKVDSLSTPIKLSLNKKVADTSILKKHSPRKIKSF